MFSSSDSAPRASEFISTPLPTRPSTDAAVNQTRDVVECSEPTSAVPEAIRQPPLDVPPQRQRRNHIASYFRRFSAVVRGRDSVSDQRRHVQPPAGSSPTERPFRITSPAVSPKPTTPSKDAAQSPISRQTSSTSASGTGSFKKRFSTFSGTSSIVATTRQATRDERASFLFARYGLGSQPSSTPVPVPSCATNSDPAAAGARPHPSESPPLLRVQKKPRLRMHTTCHECSTLFAPGSKHCIKCQHRRCRQCPRAAPKAVTDLVTQTKQSLSANAPTPSSNETLQSASRSSTKLSPTPPTPQPTPLGLHVLLIPDSPPASDLDDAPVPTIDDLLKLCSFIPTRKRPTVHSTSQGLSISKGNSGRCFENDCFDPAESEEEHEARAARPVHGPRDRVFRKVRQRRRRVCDGCGRQHSAQGDVCVECFARQKWGRVTTNDT